MGGTNDIGSPPVLRISRQELRTKFNTLGFLAKVEAGVWSKRLKDEGLARANSGEPPGTRSCVYEFLDETGTRVAVVHQYERPDGTIGGSGLPDPKQIVVEGVVWTTD